MTVSWLERARQAEQAAQEERERARLLPMRTYARKKAFAAAQGLERVAAAYRVKEPTQ